MSTTPWTEELTAKAVELYLAKEPTPETTIEDVKEVAAELGKTVNGVRLKLQQAEVYVKKEEGAAGTTAATATDKPKRATKADAQAALIKAITDAEQEVDNEIIEKLTGKAAVYLESVITGINS